MKRVSPIGVSGCAWEVERAFPTDFEQRGGVAANQTGEEAVDEGVKLRLGLAEETLEKEGEKNEQFSIKIIHLRSVVWVFNLKLSFESKLILLFWT